MKIRCKPNGYHHLVSTWSIILLLLLVVVSAHDKHGTTHALSPHEEQLSKEWLISYLSRAATISGFLSPMHGPDPVSQNTSDTIRMMKRTGVRYAGRTVFLWGRESVLPNMLPHVKKNVDATHDVLPDVILEGAIFEIVTKQGVESLPIPPHVFLAFDLPPITRNFNYTAMLFPNDTTFLNKWGPNTTVPDLTQLESRLWFFFLGSLYILNGIEALHCGQILLMSRDDVGMMDTEDLFRRLRVFANQNARRGFVLLNAHVYNGPHVYWNNTDRLLFDFHAFPSRPRPHPSSFNNTTTSHPTTNMNNNCTLEIGFEDSIYQKSAGGIHPVGKWHTEALPYLVELDNYGCTNHPGTQHPDDLFHPFGWDEISWYAHQPNRYRDNWLVYAVSWLDENDRGVGYFEMPMMRRVCDSTGFSEDRVKGASFYYASDQVEEGFGQENVIARIWRTRMEKENAVVVDAIADY